MLCSKLHWGDCGRQTVLEDVELGADSDKTIILGGFEDANGLFTLEVTCATTAEPMEYS